MKSKLQVHSIFKKVIKFDREFTILDGYAGCYYEFVSLFTGTDAQCNKECIRLEKTSTVNKLAEKYQYVRDYPAHARDEYLYITGNPDEWIAERLSNGCEIRNLPNKPEIAAVGDVIEYIHAGLNILAKVGGVDTTSRDYGVWIIDTYGMNTATVTQDHVKFDNVINIYKSTK